MTDGGATRADRLTWIGHATVALDLGGTRLLTDPLLRRRLLHLRRHGPPPAAAAVRNADGVLLSHLHLDHADLPSLRLLDRDTPVVAPRGAGRFLRRHGLHDVTELSAGEAVDLGAAHILAVPASHGSTRRPGGPVAVPLGYVVEAAGLRVYFAGDTGLFGGMAEIGAAGLDVALLPVWGWGPTLGPGHLDPAGAARAAALLRPAIAVPIHWGTFFPRGLAVLRGAALIDPPHHFAREVARQAPGVAVRVLAPGGTLALAPAGDLTPSRRRTARRGAVAAAPPTADPPPRSGGR